MLTPEELPKIQKTYYERLNDYERFSDYVRERCSRFRERHPKVARIIFSREPKVKTLASITQKIERQRKVCPGFRYESLVDIVALTVLCPYASDVETFIAWMKQAFRAEEPKDGAYKDYASGHKGYHYIVMPTDQELANQPNFHDLKAEIQIKTVLQEAFDAKSHDLAYKPGYLEVGQDLKSQFSLLSIALSAIDGQSEFLKGLIVKDRNDLELRRRTYLDKYLKNYGDMPNILQLDPSRDTDVVRIVQTLRQAASKEISSNLCKFAAYYALKLDNDLLKRMAVDLADKFVESETGDLHRLIVRGCIKWAFGFYDSSFEDMEQIINRGKPDEHSEKIREAKNNLVYFVCDCMLFMHEVTEPWSLKAKTYWTDLFANEEQGGNELDTCGFYLIMFGKTRAEIERGRELLDASAKKRADAEDALVYTGFHQLHELVALRRLVSLTERNLGYDQPV